jgi:hypothetical protein
MSWIIESLLNDRERIRSKAYIPTEFDYMAVGYLESIEENSDSGREPGYEDPSITSEEFNDLLAVETAVDTLKKMGKISEEELIILYLPVGSKTDLYDRHTLSTKKKQICDRIAYFLGGYFTDDGYIEYMVNKYGLDQKQIEALTKYISGIHKHKIIRKPIND